MYKRTESQNQVVGCVTLVIVALFFWFVFSLIDDKPAGGRSVKPTKTARVDEIDAFVWCQDHVRARLKSPSSAKFPFGEFSYREVSNNTWRIVSYVDSQNSFGAMLRTNWTCEIQYRNGAWVLQDLVLSER